MNSSKKSVRPLSDIILGTAQIGLNYGIANRGGKPSVAKSIELLETAFDEGIRTLDCAEAYGDAHQIIGSYHKIHPNSKFGIITKFTKVDENPTLKVEEKILQFIEDLRIVTTGSGGFQPRDSRVDVPFNGSMLIESLFRHAGTPSRWRRTGVTAPANGANRVPFRQNGSMAQSSMTQSPMVQSSMIKSSIPRRVPRGLPSDPVRRE